MSDTAPDLAFIARQLRQLITDVASLKDDMTVLTAIAMRQDGMLSGMLTEIRAMHAQHNRLNSRVRDLEISAGTP